MGIKKAILAGGCFWCTEAIYKRLRGVLTVTPGYAGGTTENPTYEEVSSGTTGHAEAIQIEYDPDMISYEKLLTIFFATHDPTTLNQQGADVGTQYRSVIFSTDETEKEAAESIVRKLEAEGIYPDPIVTEIAPFTYFYPAENFHRDYYDRNRSQGYCHIVISPKIAKLMKEYPADLKNEFRK
ncbi:MAG: peptide-methionine (S)-S-oxide reductase MsrA [Candidatus Moraniibacteriota bacterium]